MAMMSTGNNRPIGVFDSGVGGLTVWQQIAALLPNESTLYVADSINCPYGPKSAREIEALATGITEFLLAEGAKAIVVACNTASAAALSALRGKFDVPFIGMEPAIKPAARATRTGHVGVLATTGTLRGELFHHTRETYANHVTVHTQVAHGLVDAVERGALSGAETGALLAEYLSPLVAARVDQIVLGCTHYPFLMPQMRRFLGEGITLIDPAEAVARQVRRVLDARSARANGASVTHRFFSTGNTVPMQTLLAHIAAPEAIITPLQWDENILRRQ